MKNRKQIVIDKKFQHGKSFSMTGFAALITVVIILAVGIFISLNNDKIRSNNESIGKNTKLINSIISSQQNIFINYSLLPHRSGIADHKAYTAQMTTDYNGNVDKLNAAMSSNNKIVESNLEIMNRNFWLIITIVIMTVAGMILLYLRLIRVTHRISGPIFVMTRHMKDILEGNEPEMRDLRDNDEFKEFYVLFREVANRLIGYQKNN